MVLPREGFTLKPNRLSRPKPGCANRKGYPEMARAWYFTAYPHGLPTLDHVSLREMPDQLLAEGQVRVRNEYLSVDPYMRGRMTNLASYVEGFAIGEPMTGGAVGEVIESKAEGFCRGRQGHAHERLGVTRLLSTRNLDRAGWERRSCRR
jgi:NADPH-dependent curcumin reductase CurA